MGYPVEYLTERLFNNDRGRPYVHSTTYRWSWAAVSGTTAAEWNRQVASQEVPKMVHNLYHAGFSGIWVDLFGYNGQNSPEAALTRYLDVPHRSPDGRFLFYDMRAYNNHIALAEATNGVVLAEHPIWTTFERGFYDEQQDGTKTWRWARNRGRIVFINPLRSSRSITVSMTLQTGYDQPQRIRILNSESSEEVIVRRRLDHTLKITLAPSGLSSLAFQCDCKPAKSEDARTIYFGVMNLRIAD
jgi:phosphoglycerol transferase